MHKAKQLRHPETHSSILQSCSLSRLSSTFSCRPMLSCASDGVMTCVITMLCIKSNWRWAKNSKTFKTPPQSRKRFGRRAAVPVDQPVEQLPQRCKMDRYQSVASTLTDHLSAILVVDQSKALPWLLASFS